MFHSNLDHSLSFDEGVLGLYATNVYYFVLWAQARASATQPPAVMEAPATTTVMPSAVHAHLGGEETHATQVRLQDGVCQG